MAAQIWDPIEQRYRSIDLAQYGQDGTLTGAYAWIDGAWATLWRRDTGTPAFTWEDDFTTPALHERWMLLDGAYTPPGLTDAALLGPDLGDSFEITVTGDPGPDGVILVIAANEHFEQIEMLQIDPEWRLNNFAGQVSGPAAASGTATLRRADGQWSILVNDEVVIDAASVPISVPDTHTGPAILALNSVNGGTITHIGYRAL